MATESPMRMVEGGGARNWPSSKDSPIAGSGLKNMAAEELGLLLKGQRFHGDQTDMKPSRSGSAPPTMEGSFVAIGNLLAKQNSGMNSSLESLSNDLGNYEAEEQLRSHPAYFAYYCSNVNLNPRLPPPLISRENRHLVRHMGSSDNNWRSNSIDDIGNGTLHLSQSSLSTHEEEPEEDRSPRQDSAILLEFSSAVFSGQKTSLVGRHKSLVDLIQEDFPRTPSPVYNLSRSSHATAEEPIDLDVHAISLDVSSIDISEGPESNGSTDVRVDTCVMGPHDIALISKNDPAATSFCSAPCPDGTGTLLNPQIDDTSSKNAGLEDDASVSAVPQSDVSQAESRMRKKQEERQYQGRIMLQQYPSGQQGFQYLVQGAQAQAVSLGMNHAQNGMDKNSYGRAKFSSFELQPPMHSSGLTPPLYATAAAYMPSGNPFYPSFQPTVPGVYPPQYNVGGYALNSALFPPFVAGYPSHGPVPLPFDATSGSSFNIRTTTVSTGEGIPHGGSPQHQKFYGQQGLMVQPPFVDPHNMNYFQHPFGDAYNASVQHAWLASSAVNEAQVDPSTKKEPIVAAYMGDQNLQSSINSVPSISNQRKVGMPLGGYYGGPPSMSVMAQFPTSPIASPVLPSSPVGSSSQLGWRRELRLHQGFNRNTGIYDGWQGHRIFDVSKKPSFLEELKSSNAQKFELSDIAERIVEFSVDQHGSRFIQQKLEHCGVEEKVSVFKEVLPHASKLMTDVFGNYVIQKFFEHGSPEQRKELAEKLIGQMLPLSLQMYGCRVIQKALEVIELDQKTQLVLELDGHVMRCVRDQNGNHVIQKCIECVPAEKIAFIISAFRGHVATLSTHPYGCRVIQRVLEHCSDEEQGGCIVEEILESASALAPDQYGNYVTQHVLERGKPHERSQIFSKLTGKFVKMSQHKYASNVVEKCLEYGDSAERELLIDEILGKSEENDNLLIMMKDQYANYVVQKILEKCNDKQRETLIGRIKIHCDALKKYTYGKHIVARFEQLYGEESRPSETSDA